MHLVLFVCLFVLVYIICGLAKSTFQSEQVRDPFRRYGLVSRMEHLDPLKNADACAACAMVKQCKLAQGLL